ncbi:MAG TPA: nucleoside-diphosphate kinase [Polyangia bacterium]|jgi:nucleoside-diphosphate kinase|nr:nucleoside-diphosphate kinase [Polyangia bacterium]
MAVERTFGIVKPDAVAKGAIGGVVDMIEKAGLKIVGLRLLQMGQTQAEGFYAVHKARPFFGDLVKFMTSGPCVVMAIQGEGAVGRYREVMGPTDSKKAPTGTIRQKYGTDIERNAVHGSDSPDNAKGELAFFFKDVDLV